MPAGNGKTVWEYRKEEAAGVEQRIVFLDIDGTLTEAGSNEPPESAVRAIRQARNRGHYVFLCTGRCYGMLMPLLKYGFDGVIASSGGYVVCRDEVVYDCPMTEAQRKSAMDVLKKNGVFRTVECRDGSYTDEELKIFLGNYDKRLLRERERLEETLHIRPMGEYGGQPVYKIVAISPTMARLAEPEKVLGPDFAFCVQKDGKDNGLVNVEMVSWEFDKGRAMKRACDFLHIPLGNSVAIGDSMNDREMLEAAGVGICMGNGSRKIKELADDICPPVWEDGLYHAFLKHGLAVCEA